MCKPHTSLHACMHNSIFRVQNSCGLPAPIKHETFASNFLVPFNRVQMVGDTTLLMASKAVCGSSLQEFQVYILYSNYPVKVLAHLHIVSYQNTLLAKNYSFSDWHNILNNVHATLCPDEESGICSYIRMYKHGHGHNIIT